MNKFKQKCKQSENKRVSQGGVKQNKSWLYLNVALYATTLHNHDIFSNQNFFNFITFYISKSIKQL